MPRCRKCGEKYDEDEGPLSPMASLGEMFLESAGEETCDLCPACREEMGILALLGFGE
jgi:rubredoxin